MNLDAALSMEATEMEKMKKNVSPSFVTNGKAAGAPVTQSDQKDLISFLESPPPMEKSDWSFFEKNNLGTSNMGSRSNSTNDFALFATSSQHRSSSLSVQSGMTHGMRRTGSGLNLMTGGYTMPGQGAYDFVKPKTLQHQLLYATNANNNIFESNFIPINPSSHVHPAFTRQPNSVKCNTPPAINPAVMRRPNSVKCNTPPVINPAVTRRPNSVKCNTPPAINPAITRRPNRVKCNTPPEISIPSTLFPTLSELSSREQHLNKSWDSATFFKENQVKDEEKSKVDEINEVFQRWLDDSWNTGSAGSKNFSADNASSLDSTSPTTYWKEWDPLHIPSIVANAPQVSETPEIAKETEEKSMMRQKQTSQNLDSPQEKVNLGDMPTSKEQFLNTVVQVHSTFPCDDPLSNPGYLVSPMMPRWQFTTDEDKDVSTVKVSIATTEESNDPVVFTCNINAAVEHVVSQALCIAHEDISQIVTSDYRFRVQGRQEFLLSGTTLNLYEYVQDCVKFDEDVHLQLVHCDAVDTSLIRMQSDLSGETLGQDLKNSMKAPLTWGNIEIIKDAFFSEIEKLQKHSANSSFTPSQQCDRVHQSVKAVIQVLGTIETRDVTHAMLKLRAVVERADWSNPVRQDIFNADGSAAAKPTSAILMSSDTSSQQDNINQAVENLTTAVCSFIDIYCKAFELESSHPNLTPSAISCNVQDLVTFNIVSIHRLPRLWSSMYEEYYLSCQLVYGDQEIRQAIITKTVKANKNYNGRIIFDNWLTFPIKVSELPRETKLCLTLHGYPTGREAGKGEKVMAKEISWVNIAVFDHRSVLHQGNALYGMWSSSNVTAQLKASAMCSSNITNLESVVICVQLLSSQRNKSITFPLYTVRLQLPRTIPNGASLSSLDESTQQDLAQILSKNPMIKLSDHEQDLLWKHRHIEEYVRSRGSLARILRSVPSWAPKNLNTVYQLLENWPSIEPIEAFELLSVSFPDVYVRKFAIRCIQQAEEDEIHDYLVQLTQALKYEMFHDNVLSRFLLRSALGSLRIAHKLYWLLSENIEALVENTETLYANERYKIMLSALQAASGAKLKKEFEKEAYLVKMVNRVAEAVKFSKDGLRMAVLKAELEKVAGKVKKQSFRLPTNPALVSNGVDVADSSYFTSNATPLRLAFNNTESKPKHIHLMFKVGDDLRQDVLTMQLVTIMDKLWLAEGLDLKMVTFACLCTGKDRGFIELVSDSITLRDIQSSYGLTGAFKDRPIAEWLQKHNPTAISYEKAQENFTLSCAGYCVATYVLGICDRHNDNIMLRQSGHLFHIDFAKFLGHAQMFGNIRRDRAPFVLTSDMAYVINGGDRPSSRFHDFVDICCRAFNIVRKNSHIFVNLLSLMIHSGIPELKSISDLKYVYEALNPAASETEATALFTRLIEASLSSSFTRINFFIHNLAQHRFLGNENEDKASLSFCSKTHTLEEDGVVVEAVVVGYHKKYNPDKYYVFCIRLKREMRSGENYIYRTYSEFGELHHKLSLNFPAWKLPSFPSKVIVGRSQIKQVAERRKVQLGAYLHALLHDRLEVSKSPLIYTFFHPLLRDEQGYSKKPTNVRTVTGSISGEIKLSIHHKNDALFIMVMHCRNLLSPDGNDPDPYVKTYLLPDQTRSTKRKTKVVRKSLHPTYNEMLIYDVLLADVLNRHLCVSVWNYEQLNENDFLGSVTINLEKMDLSKDNSLWYPLTSTLLTSR